MPEAGQRRVWRFATWFALGWFFCFSFLPVWDATSFWVMLLNAAHDLGQKSSPIVFKRYVPALIQYVGLIVSGLLLGRLAAGRLRELESNPNPLSPRLDLRGVEVTEEVFLLLADKPQIESLYLNNSTLTDNDLAHLVNLLHLNLLNVTGTKITDDGLVHIGAMPGLEILRLGRTKITDAGLSHLMGLQKLWVLGLEGTSITDAGLVHLLGLSKLDCLDLSNTAITDAGLKTLDEMCHLTKLWLNGTQITDEGLKSLHGLKRLRWISVEGTQVTHEGISELKRALPDLETEPGCSLKI